MKIAIVDDESKIRLGLAKMIEQASPLYKISGSYTDGDEALRELKTNIVDVLITDIRMPSMDGLQLIEHLRGLNPDLKIIILSGFRDFDYARTALRSGVEDYLMKPVNRDELYRLLEKLAKSLPESTATGAEQTGQSRIVSLIVKEIEETYYQEFDLTVFSDKAGLNPNYIRQLFKQHRGQSITDYIMHVRVEKAKELLKYNLELKIYEVGEHVGYPDSVYFNRLFKKIAGMTPKEYKESIRVF